MRVGLGIGIGLMHGVPWVPTAPTLTAPAEAVDVYNDVGVAWSATVTAGQVPDRIDLVLDSSTVVATDSTSPYGGTWTPSGVSAGAHTLKARFVYGSGYVDSAATNIVLFDPTVIAGLVLWLRADLGVTKDGSDKVSQWADQSGAGHHAVQAVANKQPLWVPGAVNGQPAVQGDAVNDRLVANWAQSQPTTTFLVHAGNSPVTNETVIDGGGGTVNTLRVYGASPWTFYEGSGSPQRAWSAGWHVRCVEALGAGAGNLSHSVDGGAPATAVSAGTASNGVCLFSAGDDRFYCDDQIAEVIQYNRGLSADEKSRIVRKLGSRYGITVA